MESKLKWPPALHIIGLVTFILGTLDPMEGSVIIVAGSILITVASYLSHDRHLKYFLIASSMLITGVSLLFYFSSLGGFGDPPYLSRWWALMLLPYPAGWIMMIVLLIMRAITKRKKKKPVS